MKKVLLFVLAAMMVLSCVACGTEPKEDINAKSEGVMTHAEYIAAAKGDEVVIEAFVQATQGWWEQDGQGKITAYLQDKDGGYFA